MKWKLLGGAVGLGLLVGGVWWLRPTSAASERLPAATTAPRRPPLAGVEVEVLNGSGVPNLARVVTQELREAGVDVVYFGNADAATFPRGPTRVLLRSDDTTGLGRILEVLPAASVEQAPPGNRWVTFSVILGTEYAPPPDTGSTP